MKIIPFILLLFVAQSPVLKVGKYQAAKPFRYHYDNEQSLILNPDGTFLRSYYEREFHFEKVSQKATGVWQQNADTLVLTDTMLFKASVKSTLKQIFGVDDTAVIRTTKYIIKKQSKLHYISSIAGRIKPVNYPLPDFVYSPDR